MTERIFFQKRGIESPEIAVFIQQWNDNNFIVKLSTDTTTSS